MWTSISDSSVSPRSRWRELENAHVQISTGNFDFGAGNRGDGGWSAVKIERGRMRPGATGIEYRGRSRSPIRPVSPLPAARSLSPALSPAFSPGSNGNQSFTRSRLTFLPAWGHLAMSPVVLGGEPGSLVPGDLRGSRFQRRLRQ